MPLPAGVLDEQFTRLRAVIDHTRATRIIALGDLVHHGTGLTPDLIDRVSAHLAQLPQIWLVPGNHDRAITRVRDTWNLRICPDLHTEGALTFTHDPSDAHAESPSTFTWAGHIHPTVRLRSAGESFRLPCFHITAHRGILPAFSTFTAGAPIETAPGDHVYAIAESRVIDVTDGVVPPPATLGRSSPQRSPR